MFVGRAQSLGKQIVPTLKTLSEHLKALGEFRLLLSGDTEPVARLSEAVGHLTDLAIQFPNVSLYLALLSAFLVDFGAQFAHLPLNRLKLVLEFLLLLSSVSLSGRKQA